MPLRKSIIDDRLDECLESSGDDPDVAFTKLVHSIIQNCDYDDLQPEDLVDGGEDKQMDVLSLDEDSVSGLADVLIVQAKNSDSFSSSALTLLGNGLSWVFEKSKAQYQTLRNIPLVRKIDEVREFRNRSGPSNLRVRVFLSPKVMRRSYRRSLPTKWGRFRRNTGREDSTRSRSQLWVPPNW
jgi:hypothetical protein